MYRTTYFVLLVAICVSFLFFWICPYLKKLNIKENFPVVFYPANILAVFRLAILMLSVKLAIPVGKFRLPFFGNKNKAIKNGNISEQMDLRRIQKVIMLKCGPTISICWFVTALLDTMDGSIARATDTTSDFGETLDHKLLDPLGAWLALLAARSLDLLCQNGTCCGYWLV